MSIKSSILKRGWIILLFSLHLSAEPLQFQIQGNAAIVMNAESGQTLFQHEAYRQHYPASTTKVATALYVLKEYGHLLEMPIEAEQEALTTMSQEGKRKSENTGAAYWLEPDGMHIGIKKGEILRLHDLLKGMLIPSGNDAANVIAHALGPQIPLFMDRLNTYLQELGCEKTYFCNPHGLHHPQHQTTAYDLALITKEALKYPLFCEAVAQTRFIRPKTNKQSATTLLQTNRLLRPGKHYYAKAIGVKTGYHAKAKKTLIAAAQSEGRTLIIVLLGYPDRQAIFGDAIKLFEMAFNQPKVQRIFFNAGPQTFTTVIPRATPLQTYFSDPLTLDYYPAEDPQAKCLLYWHTLEPPILKHQQVGELQLVSASGNVLKKVPLLAAEEVRLRWPYSWLKALSFFPWLWILVGVLGIAMTSILCKFYRH